MKPKLGLEMHPADTQEMQLICNCCGQPYYPNKSWQDRIRAIIFGAEKYAICPLCTQAVGDEVFRDDAYRLRCRHEVARLQRLFEADRNRQVGQITRVVEPTHDDLQAAEATKQKQGSSLYFRVGKKGGVSVYGFGRFPITLYYEQWMRLLSAAKELRDFLEASKARLRLNKPQ